MAVGMGGFGFLWGGLKGLGLSRNGPGTEPVLGVLASSLARRYLWLCLHPGPAPNPLFNMQKMLGKFARSPRSP